MHPAWTTEAVYYHVYPLGALGAPERNDHHSPPAERLAGLYAWLDHVQWTGANTVLLGPVLESSTHGYDTADYYRVDRRLGSNDALAEWSRDLHSRGLRLVLDGVFHHVGRHFWAFRDVLQHGPRSTYRDWFHLDFSGRSPHGDPFAYQGWNGHYDLIKLNLAIPGRARPPAGRRDPLDRRIRHRRPAPGRRRRARQGLFAGTSRPLPRHAARLLADGRGHPQRKPRVGQPRDAPLRHLLRALQGPLV